MSRSLFTCDVVTKAWVDRQATKVARRRSIERGEELLRLRIEAGVTLREAGAVAGVDWSYIARIERGQVEPSLGVLTRLGLVYGADLSVRYFPRSGPRLRDRFQAPMVECLIRELDGRWAPTPEVAVWSPVRGVIDLKLDDRREPITVAAEIQSELHRLEQQLRWNQEKADALGERLAREGKERRSISTLLVLRSTVANREIARRFEATLHAAFPAAYEDVVAALTRGDRSWTASGLLWMSVEAGRAVILERPPRGVRVGRASGR